MDWLVPQYIFRIDDVTPEMNWENFSRIEKIFDTYWVRPIIGVVPDNQDTKLDGFGSIDDFWWKIRDLHKKWWIIAQHGYQHQYINTSSGIVGMNNYSEFAWLSYDEQYKKIQTGRQILQEKLGFVSKWWMAPAHSFDETTCKVLREIGFEYITDGIAIFPFEKYGLKWLPQQIWKPKKMLIGTWTICLHVNKYTPEFIDSIEEFCKTTYRTIPTSPEGFRYQPSISQAVLNFFYMWYFHSMRKIYIFLYK